MIKNESSFGYESSQSFLGGELDIFVRGSVVFVEGCSEDAMYLFFSLFYRYFVLVHEVL